jgi:DNA-binding NarL/FixJ family response regulator
VVDDHAGFRRFAGRLLAACGFEVVGEAADGAAAIAEAGRLRPDVVLLDVQLPGLDGFAVARALDRAAHPPAVVLTSARPLADYGTAGAGAADRFIPKSELSDAALRRVLQPDR